MEIKRIIEALLFAASEPLTDTRLEQMVLAGGAGTADGSVRRALRELCREYDEGGKSFQIVQVARGYQLKTRPEYAPWVRKLFQPRQYFRLSGPTLETLSIIAYKQPVTRPEIEAIRGVNVDGILKNLLERELIKISGQKEVAGRPYLYRTSRRFLEHFGINSTRDLPPLEPGERPDGTKFERIKSAATSSASEDVAAGGQS